MAQVEGLAGFAVTVGQSVDRFETGEIADAGVAKIDDNIIRIIPGFETIGKVTHGAK